MPYDSPSGHLPADHPHGEDQDRAAVWEDKWSRPDFSPRWRIDSIPAEIAEAVADGWLRPGARMLDIVRDRPRPQHARRPAEAQLRGRRHLR